MGTVIHGEKSPVLAAILNFCLLGCVGYFYIGQWQKGLVALLVVLVTCWALIGEVIWIVCIVDVAMQASVLKRGGSIEHWTFFHGEAKSAPPMYPPPPPVRR